MTFCPSLHLEVISGSTFEEYFAFILIKLCDALRDIFIFSSGKRRKTLLLIAEVVKYLFDHILSLSIPNWHIYKMYRFFFTVLSSNPTEVGIVFPSSKFDNVRRQSSTGVDRMDSFFSSSIFNTMAYPSL